MRLQFKGDNPTIHNGDPRKWLPGIYRSQMNFNRIVIVVEELIDPNEKTAIVVTSTGVHVQTGILTDGYILLPEGETITIEA